MRRSTLMWTVLGIAVVIGLFVIKHEVQALETRLQALNTEIIADQDATQVLQAEWAYLNQPARLEALSTRLLGMASPVAGQTQSLTEFVDRGADAKPETTPVAVQKKKIVPDAGQDEDRAELQADIRTEIRTEVGTDPGNTDWLKPILAKLKQPR